MTKADIAERVRDTLGNQKKDALDLVESVLDILKDTLEAGEEVMLREFQDSHEKRQEGEEPPNRGDCDHPGQKGPDF